MAIPKKKKKKIGGGRFPHQLAWNNYAYCAILQPRKIIDPKGNSQPQRNTERKGKKMIAGERESGSANHLTEMLHKTDAWKKRNV